MHLLPDTQWCFHSRVASNVQELDNFQLTEVGALHNDVFHQIISGDNMGTISVESSALWMCTPKEASQVADAIRCGISRPASWNSNFDVLIRQVQWLLTLSGKAFEVLLKHWIFVWFRQSLACKDHKMTCMAFDRSKRCLYTGGEVRMIERVCNLGKHGKIMANL